MWKIGCNHWNSNTKVHEREAKMSGGHLSSEWPEPTERGGDGRQIAFGNLHKSPLVHQRDLDGFCHTSPFTVSCSDSNTKVLFHL